MIKLVLALSLLGLAGAAVIAAPRAGLDPARYLPSAEEALRRVEAVAGSLTDAARDAGRAAAAHARKFVTPTAEPARTRFVTAAVERGAIVETITVSGNLDAVVTVEVGSQVSGRIDALFTDFNESVAAGDPLARIDQASYAANLAQARAQLAKARDNVAVQEARLERAQIDLREAQERRGMLEARVDNARAQATAMRRAHERHATLAARNAGTAAAVEESESAREGAEASLRETEAALRAHAHAVSGARADIRRIRAELAHARSDVAAHEAAMESAQIELERTVLRSPIAGVVVGRSVDLGQSIATGLEARTLFTIAQDLSRMEIHARVDETDISRFGPGQAARFTVDAHPERAFVARVKQVRMFPVVVQNVVTYTVVFETTNEDGTLLPGMTALLDVVVADSGPVLTLPMAALRYAPPERAGGATEVDEVWVLRADGSVDVVPVSVGARDSGRVALVQGELREGDTLIVGAASDAVADVPGISTN